MIREIQALRAIAILMVLFVHCGALLPEKYHKDIFFIQNIFFTSTGVELFFVLAGYFLMSSLSKFEKNKDIPTNLNNLAFFIIKKFKRLAPATYFWVFISLVFSFLSVHTEGVTLWQSPDIVVKKFFSTLIFLRNFAEAVDPSWLGIYWAVSLEFQTFLIITVIYFLFGHRAVLFSSLFFILLMTNYRFGEGMAWLFRFDPILLGVILFYFIENLRKDLFHKLFQTTLFNKILISFFLILILSSSFKVFYNYPNFNITISSLIACFMALLALSNNGYFYINVKYINNIIDWLASRSYSLYCCHIVVWFIVRQFFIFLEIEINLIFSFVAFLAMLFFTEFSYIYVENILIKKMPRITK